MISARKKFLALVLGLKPCGGVSKSFSRALSFIAELSPAFIAVCTVLGAHCKTHVD